MRCQDAEKKLPAISRDALPLKEREQLLEHLEQCEACSDELIRCAFRADTQGQSTTVDDPFVLAVMEGLPPQPEWAQPRPSWLPALALGLAACLLLVVGIFSGWVEPPSLIATLDRVGAQLALMGYIRELVPAWLVAVLALLPIISASVLLRCEINH